MTGDTPSVADAAPPRQLRTTEGIVPVGRADWVSRAFLAIVAFVERLNLRYAKFGNPCVYDNATFPWAAEIERDWRRIRAELDRVMVREDDLPTMQDIAIDAASIARGPGWKIFLLVAYGVKSPPGIALCPETWRMARKIPGLKTALFSVLEPGTRLPPHRGPYNGVLRLHLGLVVPEPRDGQGIRIGPEFHSWREGGALIFDDAYEHEAWNETDRQRVVLFVDFVKPLRFPANLLNRAVLSLSVFTPFIREGEKNLRRWEKNFYPRRG